VQTIYNTPTVDCNVEIPWNQTVEKVVETKRGVESQYAAPVQQYQAPAQKSQPIYNTPTVERTV